MVLGHVPDEIQRARTAGGERLCSEVAAPCLVEAEVPTYLDEDDVYESGYKGSSGRYYDLWALTDPEGVTHTVEEDEDSSDRHGQEWERDVRWYQYPDGRWSLEHVLDEDGSWRQLSIAGGMALNGTAAIVLFAVRGAVGLTRTLPGFLRVAIPALGRRQAWWGWKDFGVDLPRIDRYALLWIFTLGSAACLGMAAPWWVVWGLAAIVYCLGRVMSDALDESSQ